MHKPSTLFSWKNSFNYRVGFGELRGLKKSQRHWEARHMNNDVLVQELLSSGRIAQEKIAHWSNAAALMAAFEAMGRDGATAVLKVDGDRHEAVYTIVVSGSHLGEVFFRRDGSDVLSLLRDAVEFYRAEVWSKSA